MAAATLDRVPVLAVSGYRVVWDLLDGADLIVAAGFDPVELISPWSVRTPVLHVDTVPDTDQVYPSDTILTTDVGPHKIMAGQGWTAITPRSVLIPNGLSAMGYGVPAAIAARLTRPDRPVLALVGDGGFAMAATEMRIASSLGLPVTVVVFADNSLNRIELRQQSVGYPPTATRMDGMDLVALAEATGCDGVRAETRRPWRSPGRNGRPDPPADRRGSHRPRPVRGPVLARAALNSRG